MDAKIVRLEITDNDGEFNRETIACYYLVNPDMDKLKAIRTMIESRFDDLDAEPTFGCIDEIENDRELSTATESSSSIDLWIENEKSRIAKSDVILLKNKRQGEVVDSVLYMESSASSWKTDFLSECAELAISSETWIGNPVISDGVTATRTLSRVNFNKEF